MGLLDADFLTFSIRVLMAATELANMFLRLLVVALCLLQFDSTLRSSSGDMSGMADGLLRVSP